MLFDAKTRMNGGVAVIDLQGRATLGAEADALRTKMLQAFQHSSRYVLLNCDQLAYTDSAAIGELMAAYSTITRGGGMVKLLRPHPRMKTLLEVTGLDRVFEIFDDEGKAVGSFTTANIARSQQAMSEFLKDG